VGAQSERGVYRSADGGKTWQKVLFVNDSTGAAHLVMVPGNPRMLFAGMWQFVRRPGSSCPEEREAASIVPRMAA